MPLGKNLLSFLRLDSLSFPLTLTGAVASTIARFKANDNKLAGKLKSSVKADTQRNGQSFTKLDQTSRLNDLTEKKASKWIFNAEVAKVKLQPQSESIEKLKLLSMNPYMIILYKSKILTNFTFEYGSIEDLNAEEVFFIRSILNYDINKIYIFKDSDASEIWLILDGDDFNMYRQCISDCMELIVHNELNIDYIVSFEEDFIESEVPEYSYLLVRVK